MDGNVCADGVVVVTTEDEIRRGWEYIKARYGDPARWDGQLDWYTRPRTVPAAEPPTLQLTCWECPLPNGVPECNLSGRCPVLTLSAVRDAQEKVRRVEALAAELDRLHDEHDEHYTYEVEARDVAQRIRTAVEGERT